MQQSKRRVDITGQRFGMLTAIAPAENIDGRTAWLCRCDCGREAVVRTYHLRSGHTKSCGCLVGLEDIERTERRNVSPERYRRLQDHLTYIDGTCVEMLRAKTVRRNNTSGVTGVLWRAQKAKWQANICFKGRRYNLGYYGRFEDAVKARKRAEEELHDKFVREFSELGDRGSEQSK